MPGADGGHQLIMMRVCVVSGGGAPGGHCPLGSLPDWTQSSHCGREVPAQGLRDTELTLS